MERICGDENVCMEGALVSGSAAAEVVFGSWQEKEERMTGMIHPNGTPLQNRKKKGRKKMRYRIRLDTMADINRFVGIAGKCKGKVVLTDGDDFTVNGKSLLGAMYTFEWDRIFCESEDEIYFKIKDFIVDESEIHEESDR